MQHKNYSNTVEMGVTHSLMLIKSDIQGSISSLAPYQSDNEAKTLSTSYNVLLTQLNRKLIDLSGASTDIIAVEVATLNTSKATYDEKKGKFFRRINAITLGDILRDISYIVGMVFGVIILTNRAPLDDSLIYKLLYAIWGAIFYPLVLLYGVYDPPNWHALLIPLFSAGTPAWYMQYASYFALFIYTEPNKITPGVKNNSSTILRVFTAIVIIFWLVAQFGIP